MKKHVIEHPASAEHIIKTLRITRAQQKAGMDAIRKVLGGELTVPIRRRRKRG